MQTTIQHHNYSIRNAFTEDSITRFIHWCKNQEENRLLWLSIALVLHGCILAPITLLAVLSSGSPFLLLIIASFAMCFTLITNLAALPTKITIPVLLLSVLMDIGVLITIIAV